MKTNDRLVLKLLLVAATVWAATGLLWLTPALHEIDFRIKDSLERLEPSQGGSSSVAVVLIDDASLAKYGRWPWSRTTLANLLGAISSQQPSVIGLDVLLAEPQSVSADTALSQAIRQAGNVVLVSKISSSDSLGLWVDPIPEFANAAVSVGHAQALLDSDGVCRRFPVAEMSLQGVRYAFPLEIASQADPARTKDYLTRMGAPSVLQSSGVQSLPPILMRIPYRSQGGGQSAIPIVSARDVLEGKGSQQLKGRAVLVGFGATELHDKLVTPITAGVPTSGVEIHAHIVDAILTKRRLVDASTAVEILILLAVVLFAAFLAITLSARKAIAAIALSAFSVYAAAYLVLVFGRVSINVGPMLCAVLLSLPTAQALRLVSLDRAISRQLRSIERELNLIQGTQTSTFRQSTSTDWKVNLLEQLQAKLAADYRFEHALLEATQDGIAVFQKTGEMLFCNARFRALWEAIGDQREISSQAFAEAIAKSGYRREVFEGTLEDELLIDKNLWSIRVTRIEPRDSDSDVMVVLTDLRTRMERDQARAEALGFVTHELRTPLVAIQGFAELMMKSPVAVPEAPEVIFRESRRLVSLINSYLDVLRLDSGARPLQIEATLASELVAQVLKVLRPLADSRQITLTGSIEPLNLIVECDSALISGALLNLLSNGIKYGNPGGTVYLSVARNDDEVTFAVRNDGRPIPEEERSRLFELYFRGSDSRSQVGSGIGLAFVKRIAQKHNARLSMSSGVEKGTEFSFTLTSPLATSTKRETVHL